MLRSADDGLTNPGSCSDRTDAQPLLSADATEIGNHPVDILPVRGKPDNLLSRRHAWGLSLLEHDHVD